MFKPMLAVNYAPDKLKFPLLASPKLDGIRALVIDGVIVSRNLKPIPNKYIRSFFDHRFNGFDGELVLKESKSFQQVTSAVMSEEGEPNFEFVVFDTFINPELPYTTRVGGFPLATPPYISLIHNEYIDSMEELVAADKRFVEQGYEGTMLRAPDGKYKFGRSTVKEGYLLKVKRFEDSEAIVVGFEERLHNDNTPSKNMLGYTERSNHKANKHGVGTLGSLLVSSPVCGDFNIGTGFDDALRQEIWDNQDKYLGELVKYKHQPSGAKDKPRFPVFLGFRHENDL